VSQYQVSKLLRDVARDAEIARRCRADISAVLANYDLNEIEQDAIKKWSVRELYDMGINPLLLLTSSMAMGTDIRAYAAALKENH
jgi:Aromatic-ring-opening dioxygenase LigAB, LigA subunit